MDALNKKRTKIFFNIQKYIQSSIKSRSQVKLDSDNIFKKLFT